MRTPKMVLAATLVVATALGPLAPLSSAHADVDSASSPTIIGQDSDGNSIYSTTGPEIVDSEEEPVFDEDPILPGKPPVDDTGELPLIDLPGEGAKCTPQNRVTVTNIPNHLKVDWADSVRNMKNTPVKFTVKAETSEAFEWSVSGSVSGEFKALIFSKVSATINAGIKKTKTTTYGSTIEVTASTRDTVYADRGMWQEKFKFVWRSFDKHCNSWSGSGSGQAPYRQAWHVY